MPSKLPRIAPINLDELSVEQASVLGDRNDPRCELNFFKTLVQHPSLLRNYTPFAMQLGRESNLPLRDKEILILRVSTLCKEAYESAHHLYIAREAGLPDEEIEAARTGGEGLSPFDAALVRAAEELVKNQCVSDATWAVLAERYTTAQLIEAVFMVANYTMLAMVNNSLGIQPEKEVDKAWRPGQKD